MWEKVSYLPTHICASQRHILEAEKTVYLIVYIIFYLFLFKKKKYIDSDLVYILFVFIHAI